MQSPRPRSVWAPAIASASLLLGLLHGCGLTDFSEPERLPPELNGPCRSGSNRCSAGQTCFPAAPLGGEDFCTAACNPSELTDDARVCEAIGALLTRCHPDGADAAADCPAGLNCYRTRLMENEGVCLRIPVCAQDADCPDRSGHPTCAASLVRKGFAFEPSQIHLDHLHCLQELCAEGQRTCGTGEFCLGLVYQSPSADLCTPSCDASTPCPPNFSCAIATSGEKQRPACIPGMPGYRCAQEHCLLGSCVDTGAGFSVCTTPCRTDDDCAPLNTTSERFQCSELGHGKYCITPLPFHGANCFDPSECRVDIGEKCSNYSDTGVHSGHGECRVPCKADGTCDSRGGLPHACLGDGGCFPGQLGVPCHEPSDCFRGLTCALVAADAELDLPEEMLCTTSCEEDSQCNSDKGFNVNGYCSAGLCRIRREYGNSCVRDAQCISNRCDVKNARCLAGS